MWKEDRWARLEKVLKCWHKGFGLAQISPDGKSIAYLAPSETDVLNVWVCSLNTADDRMVTNDTLRGIRQFDWSPDSSHILYLQVQHELSLLTLLQVQQGCPSSPLAGTTHVPHHRSQVQHDLSLIACRYDTGRPSSPTCVTTRPVPPHLLAGSIQVVPPHCFQVQHHNLSLLTALRKASNIPSDFSQSWWV